MSDKNVQDSPVVEKMLSPAEDKRYRAAVVNGFDGSPQDFLAREQKGEITQPETTNDGDEQRLHSSRDHLEEEYLQAVEYGFVGTEAEYFKQKDAQVRDQQRLLERTVDMANMEGLKGTSMTMEEVRFRDLEQEVVHLNQRIDELHKGQAVSHGQFLVMLGDTLLKQGQQVLRSTAQFTTTVKLVPQEEDINDNTCKVVVDNNTVTIYRVSGETLVPFTDHRVDKSVVIDKLVNAGFTAGAWVNMNIYIS